jgi:hypothetical protein
MERRCSFRKGPSGPVFRVEATADRSGTQGTALPDGRPDAGPTIRSAFREPHEPRRYRDRGLLAGSPSEIT